MCAAGWATDSMAQGWNQALTSAYEVGAWFACFACFSCSAAAVAEPAAVLLQMLHCHRLPFALCL